MNALPVFIQWIVAVASLGSFLTVAWGIIKIGRWMGVMETRVNTAQSTASKAHERMDTHLQTHLG